MTACWSLRRSNEHLPPSLPCFRVNRGWRRLWERKSSTWAFYKHGLVWPCRTPVRQTLQRQQEQLAAASRKWWREIGDFLRGSIDGEEKGLSYECLALFPNSSIKGWECNPNGVLVLGNKEGHSHREMQREAGLTDSSHPRSSSSCMGSDFPASASRPSSEVQPRFLPLNSLRYTAFFIMTCPPWFNSFV